MDVRFTIFISVWAMLGIASVYLFGISRNAARKRRLFPWFTLLAGGLMLIFTVVIFGFAWRMLVVAVPAIALITFLNIRFTQFCLQCGRTVVNRGMWFSRSAYCPYCGAPLDG